MVTLSIFSNLNSALQKAKIPVRNIEEGRNVSMYKTNRDCIKVGPFSCPLVVSMRPIPKDQVKQACEITGRFTGKLNYFHIRNSW